MKSLLMKLGVVWIMLTSMLPSVFAQTGVLVIEISDTLNIPLSDYYIRIKDSDGSIKSYRTDSEGRVRDDNFPVGDYTYSFSFGDFNTGSFTVTSGNPTWIDIDFRRVTINFKDEKGNPASGKFVTLYKREADGTRTLVRQKTSDENGKTLFVVPEGNYTYVAADGEHDITVKGDVNTTVAVTSKLVTYQTSFQFFKGNNPITLFAKDVYVRQNQDNVFRDFGVVLAHGGTQSNSMVEYNLTDGKISCPIGEFEYSVYTRDYGTLTGTFFVTQNSSETKNIVKIVIPDEQIAPDDPIIVPDEKEPTYKLRVHAIDCDTKEPIHNLAARYSTPNGKSSFSTTDEQGYAVFKVNAGIYNVSLPSQTKEGIVVNGDTDVEFCDKAEPDSLTSQQIYFQFFYQDKEVFPQTIEKIDIKKIESGSYLQYVTIKPEKDENEGLNKFKEPVVTITGRYYYSFLMDESEFKVSSSSGNFTTIQEKPIDTVKIYFEEKYDVDIYFLHQDKTPATGSYSVSYIDRYKNNRRTDEQGHLQLTLTTGDYTFIALDDTSKFTLKKDTTIYYYLPDPEHSRNVYFKFLHDGKVVYPNVTTLSFFRNKSLNQYAYLSSSLYDDYEGMGRTYVFDKPIELPADSFTASYYIDDYEFDGQMDHKFIVNGNAQNDTTIFIVVPVKRIVEIQIKDAKGTDVQGVFAKIYKYDENGELSTALDYDGNSHSRLMSDATGIVRDHLVPGRYQIKILGIERDFEVTEYGLKFTILSDVELFNVVFKVLYSDNDEPVPGLKLDIKKGSEFYTSGITDGEGEIRFQSEAAKYSYLLSYGNGIEGNYTITKDETIIIKIDRPVLVKTIALFGEQCLIGGESTKFTAIITPDNATQKKLDWSVDNEILATISSDGTLTANTIGQTGTVTVTAKAKDDSGVFATILVNIEAESCTKSYTLAFGDGSTEMLIDDYTFDLVVTPSVNKYQYYAYQTSQDGVNWTNATNFTPETTITLESDKYFNNGTHLFRVIAADDALELLQILDGIKEPGIENITNIVILRNRDTGDYVITDKIEIPTVFTPHEVNGANDDFMPGYQVVIYNRFGDVICKSDNGWDGKYKGETADAGVYIYVLTLKDGREMKGTIQLYRK